MLSFNHEAVVAAAAYPDGRTKEYKIDGVPGLSLIVTKSGTASFYVRYQVMEGGTKRFRRDKIGRRDLIKLKDAKAKALGLMQQVAKGEDPVAKERARHDALTLAELFDERLATDNKTSARTLDDYKLVLNKYVMKTLGHLPANEVTDEQIAKALRTIEKNAPHSAHKAQSALGSTYRWARKKGLAGIKSNPVTGLGFTVQSKPRERVLSDTELAALWNSFDAPEFNATDPVRTILKLAVLAGQRNSEVSGALKSELKGLDTDKPIWRIGAQRMKRKKGKDQIVPLSKQAAALFRDAVAQSGDSEFVFPGSTHGRQNNRSQHIARGTVSNAMSRALKIAELENVRVHDQRKQITTWLAENQFAGSAVLDMILHHAPRGVTDKFYNFATLEGPLRTAFQQWADHVWQITRQSVAASNVVSIKKSSGLAQ